jgi:sulfhydrogenase subunit alpha
MIIELREFTRVEGSGTAEVVIEDGEVKDVRLKILEGPRFFELLTRGRYYYDVPDLEARICAICYASHSVASVLAIERALGVEVPEETSLLRELALLGELLESHALHLYLLVAPDLFGYSDAIRMASKHGEVVREGMAIKAFGNRIRELIGGREIHGINIKPGGFGRYPDAEELEMIERESDALLKSAKRAIGLFAGVKPYGCAASHFLATSGYLQGDSLISREEEFQYFDRIEERSLVYSFAKQSLYHGEPFLVGALSRLLLKADMLTPGAKGFLERYREKLETGYVSYNNLAQAIELVYCLERVREITGTLLDRGITGENVPVEIGEGGEGIGYVEAPRGVLVHHYRIDRGGKIKYSNVITPTAMNHAMIEASLLEEAKKLYGEADEREVVQRLEETVRAFDPCISCSVHVVRH